MGDQANPYNGLAERFNDWEYFQPQNYLISYRYDAPTGKSVSVIPLRSVSAETEVLFSKCNELNPNDPARKHILRDGAWVKEAWTTIRGQFASIFTDFSRSGQQSNKDEAEISWMAPTEQERWVYHCGAKNRAGNEVTTYAYGMFDRADFENNLGKDMQNDSGVDSSLSGSGKQKRKKRKPEQKEMSSAKKGKVNDDSIAEVLEAAMANDGRRATFEMLLKYGNQNDKEKALNDLRAMNEQQSATAEKKTPKKKSAVLQLFEEENEEDEDEEGDEE